MLVLDPLAFVAPGVAAGVDVAVVAAGLTAAGGRGGGGGGGGGGGAIGVDTEPNGKFCRCGAAAAAGAVGAAIGEVCAGG